MSIALKQMDNSKSPGTDGLLADFYKVFYRQIKNILYEVCLAGLRDGVLHLSARRGIISLLEKNNKNNLFLKSWRPLTLLNTDYKILSKVLANRLKQVLMQIIDTDQTGFLPKRYMAGECDENGKFNGFLP